MKLSLSSIKDTAQWQGYHLPAYDPAVIAANTKAKPQWLHFGSGNIFRIFPAALCQRLIEKGSMDTGIVCCEGYDDEIITRCFRPYDNLTVGVTLNADGSIDKEVIGSMAESLTMLHDSDQVTEVFRQPSLQMVSFTITEKGYAVKNTQGELMPIVKEDIANGPGKSKHAMSFVAGLLYERYKAGKLPIALVSMDNCSHNGEKLKSAVMTIANGWHEAGHVDSGFIDYISDESVVAFPWSMIDKITPRPSEKVQKMLEDMGMENIAPIITSKKTFIAPFVNAEQPQYLVIEDNFPNDRPALEKAGVYLTDRDTVNKTERMKVTTCLNPLHTALAVYGCMLGYTLICEEMKDSELTRLVNRLGYVEGLPVVTDPGIISPREFIDEVVKKRLPNPFMPDAPQRIATDTSQKVGIRFGETIKSYAALGRTSELKAIPLAIAGWLRYLLGVDDNGEPIEISADPLKDELCAHLAGIELGKPESYNGQLKDILSNETIFGSDLCKLGMDKLIEEIFVKEISGKGAVRATLKEYLD